MILQILSAIAEIFGLFFIGAFAKRLGYITDREIDRWSRLVLDFLLPAYMFTSIVKGLDPGRMHELWILPVVGLGMIFFFTVSGFLLRFGLPSGDTVRRRTFVHLCAVNNSTYLPIIILRNIWGESALANLFLLYLGTAAGVWTFGVSILGGATLREGFRTVITPVLLAIFSAILVTLTGAKQAIPDLCMRVLTSAGSVAVPLMLILIGASLAHRGILKISWPIIYAAICRLAVLPLITVSLLRFLPLPEDVFEVASIVALMPSALSSVIMTRRFGGDSGYAASVALVTTVCCIATVPVGVWLIFG